MQFRQINASFGTLKSSCLKFGPGLNIIEANNESGKSTLAAFLRVMLYGLSTRERGAAADKNRYAPWHGGAMEGSLALTHNGHDITLTRDTARANSPMGRFRAVYTGTDEAYALDGASCGEALTGVPREVYERSAFIRQSGIAVDQDAELEKRIAALITTGEESASFSEALAALKKQLNARKHNKTGAIPRLEAELAANKDALARERSLAREKLEAEGRLDALSAELTALADELARHEQADLYARSLAAQEAKRESERAAAEAAMYEKLLEADKIPDRETLLDARSQLRALRDLDFQLDTAKQALHDAENAPIARTRAHIIIYVLAALCFLPVLAFAFPLDWLKDEYIIAAGCIPAGALIYSVLKLKRERFAVLSAHEKAVQEAKAAVDVVSAARESASQELCSLLAITDTAQAEGSIESALARRDTFDALEKRAQEAQLRSELLARDDADVSPCERPERSREELTREKKIAESARYETQRTLDRIDGTLRSFGEQGELEALCTEQTQTLAQLREEYDAVALAMDALERANGELQSRFSPELGRRAAEYFAALTDGKYEAVLLDRSFNASAAEVGSPVAREVSSLSQGAADQLYLAVRLAICDLLLGDSVPLVLDDALTNFDDARCAAALEVLLKKAETQQIILLTCHKREAEYCRGRATVQTLPTCN